MKPGYVRIGLVALTSAVVGYSAYERTALAEPDVTSAESTTAVSAGRSALPVPADAKRILNTTMRHGEWAAVPVGGRSMLAWAVYPERSDKAPVIVLSDRGEPSDWLRAVGDQLAAEGFIVMAHDSASGASAAVRGHAAALPASDGQVISMALDSTRSGVDVSGARIQPAHFALTASAWPNLVAFLNRATNNQPPVVDEHAAHFAALMAQGQAGGAPGNGVIPASRKRPDLPASILTADSALAASRVRHEWVVIETPTVKLRTWVSYPEGNARTGVVIVMQQGPGNDAWERSLADQIASEGFIAVAPDLHSGLGPNGGGFDDFQFRDDVLRANARLNDDLRMTLYKAARDWALKLPRANGRTASIGFCVGGTNSFRFAGEVPELNAAVVYYGGSPTDVVLAKINAPVLGFYGEDDVRVTATVEPASATMKKLGKSYESHVYPQTTHAFLWYQEMGRNFEATAAAWPRTIAFLKQHLQ